MDIRKFFGAPKSGGKSEKKDDQNSNGNQKTNQNVKSKLSTSKRDVNGNQPKSRVKLSNDCNTNAKASSKTKQLQQNKGEEDKIVIDDDSDDDLIPCSLNSSSVTTPGGKDNKKKYDSAKKVNVDNKKHSTSKSPTATENGKSKKEKKEGLKTEKSSKNEKNSETSKDKEKKSKDSKSERSNIEKESASVKESSVRRSPRKKTFVDDNDDQMKAGHNRKRPKKITIEESEEEDVVIKESSSEDEDVVTTIKRRSGGNRKRGRQSFKVLDSDSDEDPVPKKTPQSKNKKKAAFSFVQDSDEEKVETPMDKFLKKKTTPSGKGEVKVSKDQKSEESKKESSKKSNINVSDFFGTATVSTSRVERPIAEKRKREEPVSNSKSVAMTEADIHDDDDFLAVLEQLDGPDTKKIKVSESKKEQQEEIVNEKLCNRNAEPKSDTKGSLASKLANRMKEETKDKKDTGKEKEKEDKEKEKTNGISKKASPSPSKVSSPIKSSTSIKQRKSYTLEVTKSNKQEQANDKEVRKQDDKTPQKPVPATKPQYSAKKDNDDDGFGTKKTSGFRAFKMRDGPQALGSKEIPEGADNCLEGMTFVITGVLDSIERDDAKSLVERYGGKVTTSLSKKTTYLVIGREPGQSKLSKAEDLKVKQIDEDALFDLIRDQPGKTSKYEIQAKEVLKKEESLKSGKEKSSSAKKLDSFRNTSNSEKPFTKLKSSEEKPFIKNEVASQEKVKEEKDRGSGEVDLWVDKHKPTSLKQIIGQQGDKSNANKLLAWIKQWHTNIIVKGMKASGNFFGKGGGDGAGFRAALLSGPPGIGKTTTATLVCKEAGFSYVELNASDTRSKKSLKEVVAEAVNNTCLMDFLGDDDKRSSGQGHHHCLIMDEVDGMAGNEDRGGLQELVLLIKSSKIPILCICNDRNSPKMRTLANYCFDLRFQRPRIEQIKGAMMTLAFREGLKIPASAVQEIIQAANHDIRQVIHNLSMWTVGDKSLTFDQVKADSQKAKKDLKMGPFDVCRKVFVSDDETRKMSINDKSDLFFHDYSFAPLFVHENYPNVIPAKAQGNKAKHLACLSHTIDSLCDGDLVEKLIRKEGNWGLLPTQAMYSSVLPGEFMRGSFPQMTAFPLWLGKNSSTGKTDRLLQELSTHMSLKVSCDKRGLNQDYLPTMRTCLTAPLASLGQDGVPGVLNVMKDYDLIKDDFDSILEVAKWPNSVDFMAKVEPKTKAAFTRMYNKSGHVTPYSTGAGGKKKRGGTSTGEEELLREEGEEDQRVESEEEEDDTPAVLAKPKGKATKGKQESTKGKGKAKGKK